MLCSLLDFKLIIQAIQYIKIKIHIFYVTEMFNYLGYRK